MKKIILYISILLLSLQAIAVHDSLFVQYSDTTLSIENRLKAIGDLAWLYTKIDTDTSILYAYLELALAQKICVLNDSICKHFQGDAYNTLGVSYKNKGEYLTALEYYHSGLDVKTAQANLRGVAISHINIGNIHNEMKQFEMALKHFQIAKSLCDSIGFIRGYASVSNNMGIVYKNKGKYEEAIASYKDALKLGNEQINASVYSNIGNLFLKLNALDSVQFYLSASYTLLENSGNNKDLAVVCNDLGILYTKRKKYQKAIKYAQKALSLTEKTNSLLTKSISYETLYIAHKALGNHKKALSYLEYFKVMQDSIFSEKNTQAITEKELRFEFEKTHLRDSIAFAKEQELKDVEIAKQKEIVRKEEIQRYYLFAIIVLIIIFAIFIYRRLQITRQQKIIISKQKEEIEEVHEEIKDSITYAKRIQNAILPAKTMVNSLLPHNFIFYRPKDIVAGDFYWLEQKNDCLLFAVADCTGHGVPGAMVSVVCNNGLNRSVREYGLTDPGKILDKTREIVLEEFSKSEDNVQDGMDIALCTLKGNQLSFAGAYNPLWIVRNGELLETKGDRQPIGTFDNSVKFTTYHTEVQKGDIIYLFSDGFNDQFGGKADKKFSSAQLKKLLLSMNNTPMNEQLDILISTFDKWMADGNNQQLDDVCIMGIQI